MSREQEREGKGVPTGEFHPSAAPNHRLQATPSSLRSVRREAAWKNVETPWVDRYSMSPWREALSTTL